MQLYRCPNCHKLEMIKQHTPYGIQEYCHKCGYSYNPVPTNLQF